MKEKDPTVHSHRNDTEEDIVPMHLTAIRMFRSLLPPSDQDLGLDDPRVLKEKREHAQVLLLWPPNLFAFTSEILMSTGAYFLAVSPAKEEPSNGERPDEERAQDKRRPHERKEIWPPQEYDRTKDGKTVNIWHSTVRDLGLEWRKRLNKKKREFFITYLDPKYDFKAGELEQVLKKLVPQDILNCWHSLSECFDTKDIKGLLCVEGSADDKRKHWQAFIDLMTLHAVADEACLGWGIREYITDSPVSDKTKSAAQKFAELFLEKHGTLATIHEDRCRILPKRHTPNVGMTLRSISINLAFYHRSSVEVKWRPAVKTPLTKEKKPISSLHVLLLPWPYSLHARDFEELTNVPYRAHTESEGFFQYRPQQWHEDDPRNEAHFIKKVLPDVLEKANKEAKRIDLVILPELAICEHNVEKLESALKEANVSGYIAGVRSETNDEQRFNRNMLYCKFAGWDELGGEFDFPKSSEDYRQHKHHRWKLDRFQIIKYKLASLPTNRIWWEGIKLARRKVTFVNVGEQITICPLICEDLARQEPISDLIRAVGPTLVVAILMDGPQKWSRWSAGYASVLADDPRSSVLTFSCLGMVERMQQASGVPNSRAVALWKDSFNVPTEIELDANKDGIVLYLNVEENKELTADGRRELVATPYLTYGGTVCV